MRHVVLLALLVVCTPLYAERGTTRNGLPAQGNSEGFEVFTRPGLGGVDYFCAAGDFARTYLNAGATDRVEIIGAAGRSRTRPNRHSIIFAVRPPGSGRNTGLDVAILRPRSVGVSRTVAQSVNFCSRPEVTGGD